MAHPNPLVSRLTSLLPRDCLMELAREGGFVLRKRKVDPIALFWVLVLGMIATPVRSLAALQRLYHEHTGEFLASSSFQGRFNDGMAKWLGLVFAHALEAGAERQRALSGILGQFQAVLLMDSTILRLHELLAKRYPGCRTNHSPAAAKLNVLYNVTKGRIANAQIAVGTCAETKLLRPGAWMKGALLLFDLGYFKLQTFWRIHQHGGYFLTRMKKGGAPVILKLNRVCRGRSIDPVGRKVAEVLPHLQREVLDCEVEYRVSRKGLPGRPTKDQAPIRLRLRLVALRNEDTGQYHTYLTNIPPELLSAEQIAETYRARWWVELLFKQMKTLGGLEAWPTRKEPFVKVAIYVSLLGIIVNRQLLLYLEDRLAASPLLTGRRIATHRWSRVFVTHSAYLLAAILGNLKQDPAAIARFCDAILREAIEPKRSKLRLEAALGA